jgi:hypothetical protein
MGNGTLEMTKARKNLDDTPDDERVAAVVQKHSIAYRDRLTGLTETTLIPVATIVRDALAKRAECRDLPGPPRGSRKSQWRVGDRRSDQGKASEPKRSGGKS